MKVFFILQKEPFPETATKIGAVLAENRKEAFQKVAKAVGGTMTGPADIPLVTESSEYGDITQYVQPSSEDRYDQRLFIRGVEWVIQ